jgi:hypothetical protein
MLTHRGEVESFDVVPHVAPDPLALDISVLAPPAPRPPAPPRMSASLEDAGDDDDDDDDDSDEGDEGDAGADDDDVFRIDPAAFH